ncbi:MULTISPECIES: Sec-independent protein translocase protein TatB [Paracoccus]|jgi:sec-independent protein translocase protein TatB|uniref:Sec-independent protein translocase protein TatB n=1 Tax=Paracoccus litorisediminis TaxID=2006130 RepID=A0A844HPQ9_9RHOB|nr:MULTISPECIES: Sec-independent protein translocase protein TatB [Paracoccus]MBD9526711.1 twin-arginine translocase subunit TatB [Paracoccus sp. PAR01]MTH59612.1 twin-arginine translocase subunit TatB [Paracoccus litorisediminis]
MLDIGWSELLLIGVVALIVIGPEDLPKLFHTLGRLTARARGMAREFTSAMEDAAKSSGLDEAGKALRDVNSLTSKKSLGLDALERATERFEKWDPLNPRDEAAKTGPVPDPAAPAAPQAFPEGSRFAAPAPAPTPAADAPLPPAPGVEAPHPVADDAGSDTAGGKRRLHAVRRSDQ